MVKFVVEKFVELNVIKVWELLIVGGVRGVNENVYVLVEFLVKVLVSVSWLLDVLRLKVS